MALKITEPLAGSVTLTMAKGSPSTSVSLVRTRKPVELASSLTILESSTATAGSLTQATFTVT